MKLIIVAWLVLPQFRGATFIYETYVREKIIKNYGDDHGKAKKKNVHFMTPTKIKVSK